MIVFSQNVLLAIPCFHPDYSSYYTMVLHFSLHLVTIKRITEHTLLLHRPYLLAYQYKQHHKRLSKKQPSQGKMFLGMMSSYSIISIHTW